MRRRYARAFKVRVHTSSVHDPPCPGHGPVQRIITTLAGLVRPGNSVGPLIDTNGRVDATIFAARTTTTGGYATPNQLLPNLLAHTNHPVPTDGCAD